MCFSPLLWITSAKVGLAVMDRQVVGWHGRSLIIDQDLERQPKIETQKRTSSQRLGPSSHNTHATMSPSLSRHPPWWAKGSCEWSKTIPCHRWRQSARDCNTEQYIYTVYMDEEDSVWLNCFPLPTTSHSLTHQSIERQKIGLMSSPIEFLSTSASCECSKRKMWHPKNERSKSCRAAQNHACPIQSFIWQYWCQLSRPWRMRRQWWIHIIVLASSMLGKGKLRMI